MKLLNVSPTRIVYSASYNIMHPKEPLFVVIPAVLINSAYSYFVICAAIIKIRQILLKQFDLIILDINTVKHPRWSPCPWKKYVPVLIRRLQNYFDSIHAHSQLSSLCHYGIHLWRHGVHWDCDIIADVDKGWGECFIPICESDSRRQCLSQFTSNFAFFWIISYSIVWKELRMVTCALWRSEVLKDVPWLCPCTTA